MITDDAPEYHTKPTTPLSPLPVHPPEPSNVTVLRNQIDPTFNMTETHLEQNANDNSPMEPGALHTVTEATEAEDVNSDSSFSDAYAEVEEDAPNDEAVAPQAAAEPEDDYAMTFDSDGEDGAEKNSDQGTVEEENPASTSTSTMEQTISATSNAINAAPASPNPPSASLPPPTTSTTQSIPSPVALEQSQSVPNEAQSQTTEDSAGGEVDIQQLLDNITARAEMQSSNEAASSNPTTTAPASSSAPSQVLKGLPAHASLPPRPQNSQTPLTPTYPSYDITRSYSGVPSMPPPPGIGSFGAPGVAPGTAVGAPGTSSSGLLPPPPSSLYPAPPGVTLPPNPLAFQPQYHVPSGGNARQEQGKKERNDGVDYGEVQWSPSVQKLYEEFLEDERGYVSDGQWDKFPAGSRLFIGNLPTEKVTKRDIFFMFHKYGRLGQISIKQAYGFVQFLQASSSHTALEREQGQLLRGRKMHLEISKPQKNTKQANTSAMPNSNPRQRSPDYSRGGRNEQSSRNPYENYDSRGQGPRRSTDFGVQRTRDEYRPGMRSPSPPSRGGFRGRDEYPSRGGRDYNDGGRRSRSKSPPYGRRDNGRYRQRSPSPRSREMDEDAELQIPRRNPRDVPDVFIILLDELDRNFVSWVEGEIRGRNLKTEVMFLSPRVPLAAVIRRQILEGVHAVTQLTRASQNSSKIPLQVFDRKAGANNVRFDEYQDLDPKIAAELVIRTKQAEFAPAYNPVQFQSGQSYHPSAPTPPASSNLASLVGSLDNASLQQLLGSLGATGQQQQSLQAAIQSNSAIDLAGILGGLTKQAAPQQNYQQPQQEIGGYNLANNPQLAALLTGQAGQQPSSQAPSDQQSQQQVQNIMAQLARFRQ